MFKTVLLKFKTFQDATNCQRIGLMIMIDVTTKLLLFNDNWAEISIIFYNNFHMFEKLEETYDEMANFIEYFNSSMSLLRLTESKI